MKKQWKIGLCAGAAVITMMSVFLFASAQEEGLAKDQETAEANEDPGAQKGAPQEETEGDLGVQKDGLQEENVKSSKDKSIEGIVPESEQEGEIEQAAVLPAPNEPSENISAPNEPFKDKSLVNTPPSPENSERDPKEQAIGAALKENPALVKQVQILQSSLEEQIAHIRKLFSMPEQIDVQYAADNLEDIFAVYAVINDMTDQFPSQVVVETPAQQEELLSIFWHLTRVSGKSGQSENGLEYGLLVQRDTYLAYGLTDTQRDQAASLLAR